jgi:predicted dehydrogenase
VRRVLDNKDVDAVVIASCNHWHCLSGIWAMQAGKDAYVEKPISNNVWEGRKLVEAARKYNRIVQGGTQQRSDPVQAQIKAFLAKGSLGRMKFVRLNIFKARQSIGKLSAPMAWPTEVDKEQWLGPAQDEAIVRPRLSYDWHWDWNTGAGELGNWGPHVIDDCRNVAFNDRVTLPTRVVSGGGRFAWDDAGQTPNTHFVCYDTDEVPVVMAVHNLPIKTGSTAPDVYRRLRSRAFLVIQCENGYYAGGRGGGAAFDDENNVIAKFSGDGGEHHAANFLDAVRSRKQEQLAAEIEQTHYSSAWCHLGNASYRLGRAYQNREAIDAVKDSGPWAELIDDFTHHCAANDVDPSASGAKLGPMLEIDVNNETLTGPTATPEALALLRREYRAGFEIPERL